MWKFSIHSFVFTSLFFLISCEGINVKVWHPTETSTTPPVVESPVTPTPPPVAPPDPIETGASGILSFGDPICVNYRSLTFDYSGMPDYDIEDNVIVSTTHGGTAEVKAIGVASGSGSPYRTDLDPHWGCNSSWYPGGSICQFPEDTSEGVRGGHYGAT